MVESQSEVGDRELIGQEKAVLLLSLPLPHRKDLGRRETKCRVPELQRGRAEGMETALGRGYRAVVLGEEGLVFSAIPPAGRSGLEPCVWTWADWRLLGATGHKGNDATDLPGSQGLLRPIDPVGPVRRRVCWVGHSEPCNPRASNRHGRAPRLPGSGPARVRLTVPAEPPVSQHQEPTYRGGHLQMTRAPKWASLWPFALPQGRPRHGAENAPRCHVYPRSQEVKA